MKLIPSVIVVYYHIITASASKPIGHIGLQTVISLRPHIDGTNKKNPGCMI